MRKLRASSRTLKRHRCLARSIAVVIVGGAVAYAALVWWIGPFYRRDLRVHLTNAGQIGLRGVKVHVTGKTYALGDMAAGQKTSTTVRPTSESHVEIGFESSPGVDKRLNAGGYFESSCVGDIHIRLDGERIVDVKHVLFP